MCKVSKMLIMVQEKKKAAILRQIDNAFYQTKTWFST